MPQSGLLQSAMVSLYVLYLTWSAVSNSPQDECKPAGFLPRFPFIFKSQASFISYPLISARNPFQQFCCSPNTTLAPGVSTTTAAPGTDGKAHPHFSTESLVGLIVWFLCVLYSSISTSGQVLFTQQKIYKQLLSKQITHSHIIYISAGNLIFNWVR